MARTIHIVNFVRILLATPVLVALLAGTALPCSTASAQSHGPERFAFLDGRGSIDLPPGTATPLDSESSRGGLLITSGIHKYFFRTLEVAGERSAQEFLDLIAEQRMQAASSDVTVNLDRIECGDYTAVDLTHWMWHPTAKPQGLLLSKDRLIVLENLLILITVEGVEAGIIELTVDEYLNSIRYMGEAICLH